MNLLESESRAQNDARRFAKAFGWLAPLGHLLPPYRHRSPVPPGYVDLSRASKEVYVRAGQWGIQLDWGDVILRTAVAERLGQAAASGEIVIFGTDARTGEIYQLPRELWLTTVIVDGRVCSPAHFAGSGGLLRLPPPHHDVQCRAFVSFHDLAVVMRALDPPPRPGPAVLATVPLHVGERGRDRGTPDEERAEDHSQASYNADAQPSSDDRRGEPPGSDAASDPAAEGLPAQDSAAQGQAEAGGNDEPGADGELEPPITTYRTGAEGHPTSKALVAVEMRRRARAGIMCATITEEAKALAAWLPKAHPPAAPMGHKTIQNQLNALFRDLAAARNGRPK